MCLSPFSSPCMIYLPLKNERRCLMKNDIITWLNFKDVNGVDNLDVKELISTDQELVYELRWNIPIQYCPCCNYRMHSKGYYTRTVLHQILQDNRTVKLKLIKKKWKCNNCGYFMSDEFPFVNPSKRVTNTTDILIVESFRDYNLTTRQISERFKVSDTYALQTFDRYVDLPRLPLSSVICIDEVNLNIDKDCVYALVLQDFITGEIIDLLPSRREEITEAYFASIPKQERLKVKYLISDMYDPYQRYTEKYFINAIPIVDSFHVVKLIVQKIIDHMNVLKKGFIARDNSIHKAKEIAAGKELPYHDSHEVYLLKNKQWLVVKNNESIKYSSKGYLDKNYDRRLMYTVDYEHELFKLIPELEEIRDLKELYIQFNKNYCGNPAGARSELDNIIEIYRDCGYPFFKDISKTLKKHKEAILNSFTILPRLDNNGNYYESRLSNGPIESLNRIPKDMKRNCRGFQNFEHLRNRLFFATRKNAPISAHPKPLKDVKFHTERKRGPYKKISGNGNVK